MIHISTRPILQLVQLGVTCEVKEDFGQIPENIKKQIKAVVKNSETLPLSFVQKILTS